MVKRNSKTMVTREQEIQALAEKIREIVKKRGNLIGCRVRWTSTTARLQMTGEVIGIKVKRRIPHLVIQPDNENFNNFFVPPQLLKSIFEPKNS